MILWTIQDKAVWEELEKTGSYSVDPARIEFPEEEDDPYLHANHAYRWLARQMEQRIGPPPKDVAYPVWAWYKQRGQHDGKPDMRESGNRKLAPCVRMELDVPDWEVLLTDADLWSLPLNYAYCALNEDDDRKFDAWCESLGVGFHDIGNWNLNSPELDLVRAKVEDSWERVLGVRPVDEHWVGPWEERAIQATFWVLRRENVISVEEFGTRDGS